MFTVSRGKSFLPHIHPSPSRFLSLIPLSPSLLSPSFLFHPYLSVLPPIFSEKNAALNITTNCVHTPYEPTGKSLSCKYFNISVVSAWHFNFTLCLKHLRLASSRKKSPVCSRRPPIWRSQFSLYAKTSSVSGGESQLHEDADCMLNTWSITFHCSNAVIDTGWMLLVQ